MVDQTALMCAIAGLSADAASHLTASFQYRAVVNRAAGRLDRAAWEASVVDVLTGRLPASAVFTTSSHLSERELARLIFEYESAIADFESHCGGALLGWNQAVLTMLRRSLASRRNVAPQTPADIDETSVARGEAASPDRG